MSELADSEVTNESTDFNMEEAQESLASDLFNVSPETEEPEDVATEEVADKDEEETKEVRAAPQSWKKEMHEHWSKLDPEVQDYFALREQQMKEGIDVAKEDAVMGRDFRDVLNPYNELFASQNVEPKAAVQYLLYAHHVLSTADEQGKLDAFNHMAASYGIKLDGSKVTPEIQSLQSEISQLKQIINQGQQESKQEKQAKVMQEVDAFASENDLFDEVSDDMIPFLSAGHTLQEAYDKAIWANPVTRQKLQDKMDVEKTERLEKEKQEKIEKAKKAKSANVKTRYTGKAPTETKGKMFDGLEDLAREINSR